MLWLSDDDLSSFPLNGTGYGMSFSAWLPSRYTIHNTAEPGRKLLLVPVYRRLRGDFKAERLVPIVEDAATGISMTVTNHKA